MFPYSFKTLGVGKPYGHRHQIVTGYQEIESCLFCKILLVIISEPRVSRSRLQN
jgi:hypothetical protein